MKDLLLLMLPMFLNIPEYTCSFIYSYLECLGVTISSDKCFLPSPSLTLLLLMFVYLTVFPQDLAEVFGEKIGK